MIACVILTAELSSLAARYVVASASAQVILEDKFMHVQAGVTHVTSVALRHADQTNAMRCDTCTRLYAQWLPTNADAAACRCIGCRGQLTSAGDTQVSHEGNDVCCAWSA